MKLEKTNHKITVSQGALLRPYTVLAGSSLLSVAEIVVNDMGHGGTVTTAADRFYLVQKGSGIFNIDGEVYPVSNTDVMVIPRSTPYNFFAEKDSSMTVLLFNTPTFDSTHETPVPELNIK